MLFKDFYNSGLQRENIERTIKNLSGGVKRKSFPSEIPFHTKFMSVIKAEFFKSD